MEERERKNRGLLTWHKEFGEGVRRIFGYIKFSTPKLERLKEL